MGHKNIPLACAAKARMSKILNNPNLLVDKFRLSLFRESRSVETEISRLVLHSYILIKIVDLKLNS